MPTIISQGRVRLCIHCSVNVLPFLITKTMILELKSSHSFLTGLSGPLVSTLHKYWNAFLSSPLIISRGDWGHSSLKGVQHNPPPCAWIHALPRSSSSSNQSVVWLIFGKPTDNLQALASSHESCSQFPYWVFTWMKWIRNGRVVPVLPYVCFPKLLYEFKLNVIKTSHRF
jgi:hypothetical protein